MKETKRPEVTDVFVAVCSVCTVSRWVSGEPFVGIARAVREKAHNVWLGSDK